MIVIAAEGGKIFNLLPRKNLFIHFFIMLLKILSKTQTKISLSKPSVFQFREGFNLSTPNGSAAYEPLFAYILVHLVFKNKVYMYILFNASRVYGTLYFRFPLETLSPSKPDWTTGKHQNHLIGWIPSPSKLDWTTGEHQNYLIG